MTASKLKLGRLKALVSICQDWNRIGHQNDPAVLSVWYYQFFPCRNSTSWWEVQNTNLLIVSSVSVLDISLLQLKLSLQSGSEQKCQANNFSAIFFPLKCKAAVVERNQSKQYAFAKVRNNHFNQLTGKRCQLVFSSLHEKIQDSIFLHL